MSPVSKCSPARPSWTTPLPRARCPWDLRMNANKRNGTLVTTSAGVAIAAMAALLLLAGCGKDAAPEAARATPVRIEHASQGPAVPPIDTSGIVVTKHEMRLSFKMGGLVRRIYVSQGQAVKKGQ